MLSSLMAMLLQALCARLGVASGRDLAQACQEAIAAMTEPLKNVPHGEAVLNPRTPEHAAVAHSGADHRIGEMLLLSWSEIEREIDERRGEVELRG